MKRILAVFLVFSFLMFNLGLVSLHAADPVTQTIASVAKAQEIAAAAGGAYVEGAAAPALTGTQVALPVIDGATGSVLGHVVAEQASLVSALNTAGYTSVASAVAATQAGTTAGLAVGAGITAGTVTVGAAAVAGAAALIVASGGGTTSGHHH